MSAFKQYRALLKKEALYIVRDRKTLVTTIIMTAFFTPLLLWGVSQLGQVNRDSLENKVKHIALEQNSENTEFAHFIKNKLTDKYEFSTGDFAQMEQKLKNNEIDLVIAVRQDPIVISTLSDPRNNLSIFAEKEVNTFYQQYAASRAAQTLATNNLSVDKVFDTQLSNKQIKIEGSADQTLAFLIPYLLILGLVQGGMQYAMETTSGEKERQTLATTLSLAASPVVIGLAKISSVLLWSLGLALINITSVVFTFQYVPGLGSSGVNLAGFGFDKIAQLLFIAIPLSFLISTGMVALGLFARNLKEGYSYATPLLIVSVFAAISSNFFDLNTPLYMFAIPLLGQIAAIKQVIFGSLTWQPLLVVTLTTCILFFILFWCTIRLFRKEEVLFRV